MSSRALIALVARSIRDAQTEKKYKVGENSYGDDVIVSQAELDNAEEVTGFDRDPRDLLSGVERAETQDGDEYWVTESFDLEAAREALRKVKTLKKVEDENGDFVYLTQKEFNALKPEEKIEFDFTIPDADLTYEIKIDLAGKRLEVGCQDYTFSEWKRRGNTIIEEQLNGYTDAVQQYAKDALAAALEAIDARITPSRPRRSRAKTAGRRSRRSSGRTRSRR